MLSPRTRGCRLESVLTFAFVLVSFIFNNPVQGVSLELRLTQITGLTKDVKGQTESMVVVHECSPICSLIGIESLLERNDAHVISADGIHGAFRLSITLRKRTRPPPQERAEIPIEIIEREGSLGESYQGGQFGSDERFSELQSSFESHSRVLVTGSAPGEKGKLNHNWRERDELIAQYVIDTTVSAVRRCRKACMFHSGSSFVQRSLSNATLDIPTFKVQLAAFRDSASERSDPAHLLFAGYFAEAIEKSNQGHLDIPFDAPGQSSNRYQGTSGSNGENTSGCYKYRFITRLGGEVAYVWHLYTGSGEANVTRKSRLDAGSNYEMTVVAFKDLEKSSRTYQDVWGRSTLCPVEFVGSNPYTRFTSFGKVHNGLHKRYNSIAEELRTWIRPGTNVLVTGTFAGGALASFAYADWLSDKDMDVGMAYGVTFGATQAGDKLFQKAFRELGRYEPSRASYGFFEQVIAADKVNGRVDIASRMPSALFESIVPYPGVHSVDCLRSFFPVAEIALSSPGHLRLFRTVGRRRLLFAGRKLQSDSIVDTRNVSGLGEASRDILREFGNSVFAVQGRPMDHYMEWLYSVYYDLLELRHSDAVQAVARAQVMSGYRDADRGKCEMLDRKNHPGVLTVQVELTSEKGKALGAKTVGMSLCERCRSGLGCRQLLAVGESAETKKGGKSVKFASMRPFDSKMCVQFHIEALHRPATCATGNMPKEVVRLASTPGIELKEVLGFQKKQRCHINMDGVRLYISAEVVRGFDESSGISVLKRESKDSNEKVDGDKGDGNQKIGEVLERKSTPMPRPKKEAELMGSARGMGLQDGEDIGLPGREANSDRLGVEAERKDRLWPELNREDKAVGSQLKREDRLGAERQREDKLEAELQRGGRLGQQLKREDKLGSRMKPEDSLVPVLQRGDKGGLQMKQEDTLRPELQQEDKRGLQFNQENKLGSELTRGDSSGPELNNQDSLGPVSRQEDKLGPELGRKENLESTLKRADRPGSYIKRKDSLGTSGKDNTEPEMTQKDMGELKGNDVIGTNVQRNEEAGLEHEAEDVGGAGVKRNDIVEPKDLAPNVPLDSDMKQKDVMGKTMERNELMLPEMHQEPIPGTERSILQGHAKWESSKDSLHSDENLPRQAMRGFVKNTIERLGSYVRKKSTLTDVKCENERMCRCKAVEVEECVRSVPGQSGWCAVDGCREMRCRCDGTALCEKRYAVVFQVVGERAGRFVKCVAAVGVVAVLRRR